MIINSNNNNNTGIRQTHLQGSPKFYVFQVKFFTKIKHKRKPRVTPDREISGGNGRVRLGERGGET